MMSKEMFPIPLKVLQDLSGGKPAGLVPTPTGFTSLPDEETMDRLRLATMKRLVENPFDPNLTSEQKAFILERCRVDADYFFEHCVKPSDAAIAQQQQYRIMTLPVRRQRQTVVRKIRRSLDAYFAFMEQGEALRYGHDRWKAGNPDSFAARMEKVRRERLELRALFELGQRILHKQRTGEKDH